MPFDMQRVNKLVRSFASTFEAFTELVSPEGSDPYSVLGILPNAPDEVLEAAYKAKAKKTHPDTENGNEAEFKRITEAYERIKKERKEGDL